MVESAGRHGEVLPQTGNVGESQIDHLDLVVLYRLEKIFGTLARVSHLPPPFFKRGQVHRSYHVGRAHACEPARKRQARPITSGPRWRTASRPIRREAA